MPTGAEKYYRFVRPIDWYDDGSGLKSSAFKDGHGYSVDQDGGRDATQFAKELFERRTKRDGGKEGVISFLAGVVVACEVDVVEEPLVENPHHCMFVDDALAERLRLQRMGKVKCLQRGYGWEEVPLEGEGDTSESQA